MFDTYIWRGGGFHWGGIFNPDVHFKWNLKRYFLPHIKYNPSPLKTNQTRVFLGIITSYYAKHANVLKIKEDGKNVNFTSSIP